MRCVSPCRTLALGTACLLVVNCAAPRRVLLNPGDVYLTHGSGEIRIRPDNPLTIQWEANGTIYTTAEATSASNQRVLVRLVEANGHFLRVRSEAWKDMDDIPIAVRDRSGIRVTAGSGRHKHPIAAIPVDSITAIGVCDRLPRLERSGPRDVPSGIAVGVTWGMMAAAALTPPERPDARQALIGTVAAGLAGAVVYPIWQMLRPKHRIQPVEYTIDAATYRLEIR